MAIVKRTCLFLLFAVPKCLLAQSEADIAEFERFFNAPTSVSPEEVIAEASLNLEQVREIGDARAESVAARNLGLILLNHVHDYERALDLLIRAAVINDSIGLPDQQVLTYISIARLFEVVSDYYKSAQYLEQALTLNRDKRNINAHVLILNRLGKVNAQQGRQDEALRYYEQVLRYREDIDQSYEAEALFNLAHLFTQQGSYEKALEYHRKALRVSRALGDRRAEATSLNDVGVLYSLMKNSERSQANHLVALEIRTQIGDRKGMAESYNNIAAFHLASGNVDEAISYGQLALEHGHESQARDEMLKSYELLSQACKELGDFRKALEYKELGVAIQELIVGEKQDRRLLEAQNRYVIAAKESQIQKLDALRLEKERELAAQKEFRNILYLVVVLICIAAGLLFVLYLVKRRSNHRLRAAREEVERQNEQLQQLNQTKDKFFSIISHDLKGPLNSLTSFSRLLIDHTDKMTKDEIQLLAKDLDMSVRNLLTLLENLLEWSRSQTGSIEFTPEPFSVAELLSGNRNLLKGQAESKRIDIIQEVQDDLYVRLHKNSISTVVRNLISNAIKFTPEGGAIRVGAKTDRSSVRIFVADSGVGMTREVVDKLFRLGTKHSTRGTADEKGTGLGLVLCREFVEKNGGIISVDSAPGKGSVFECTFPIGVVARVPERAPLSP